MAQQDLNRLPSPHSTDHEDDENAELFSAVLSTLNREQLPLVGMAILQRTHPAVKARLPSVGKPMYGSYHVLLRLCSFSLRD
jgi:hypothetical protein